MGPILAGLGRVVVPLAFSGAAFFTSLGFFNASRKPADPAQLVGHYAMILAGMFLLYKLAKEVLK